MRCLLSTIVGVLTIATVAGCSGGGTAGTSDDAVADHARIAGTVMTRDRGPLPARAAAVEVTGQTSDTTIAALAATGSTWGGTITLRIVVSGTSGTSGSEDRASGCFTYHFAYPRTDDNGHPHEVSCGSRRPLDLTQPPQPTGVTASTRRVVTQVLMHLSAIDRAAAPAVRRSLSRALGADYTIDVGNQDHVVLGFVRYGEQCLTIAASRAHTTVKGPLHGDDCFGG